MSKENEKITNEAEKIKKETAETAKQVKDSVKNVNIKDETKKTKGFVIDMFKNPLNKLEEISKDGGTFFKTAIFMIIIWIVAVFIKSTYSTIYYWGFSRVFSNIIDVLKNILVPIISVLVYSLIIFILNKENKKSLIEIISVVTATKLPIVIASIVSILTIFSYEINKLTIAFSSLCNVLTIVLSYFGYKAIFSEKDDKKFIKKFAIIEIIYCVVYVVLTFLGIYIY